MHPESSRWVQATPSAFAWERAALDYIRGVLPDADPWRAWANFEIVDDRGVAEVDLMVLSPWGLWVIEIKSRPGVLSGDAHTWTWRRPNGSTFADDNPLIGCDRKAKRIKSLLGRTRQVPPGQLPFLEALVFLHATPLEIHLSPPGRKNVVAADATPPEPGAPPAARPDGIAGVAQVLGGVDPAFRRSARRIDATQSRFIAAAVARAGIRESNRAKRVGNYELVKGPISEGAGWQDFEARHLHVERIRRRVRIWSTQTARTDDERTTRSRAAKREFQALEGISHPGILGVVDYVPDAERGPSVVFEHDPEARRLDLWVAEHHHNLDLATRLALLRGVADALRYAHQRRLAHRALTPRSVLVSRPDGDHPVPKVFNWQTAERHGTAGGSTMGPVVTATEHVGDLLDADAGGYLAPELFTTPDADGVTLDVFSLGTVAYLVLTGQPPADSPAELAARLRRDHGLLLSGVLDGVDSDLEAAVQLATAPAVGDRLQAVDEFYDLLTKAEASVAASTDAAVDPLDAGPGDVLDGGWRVIRPLGRGSCATALLATGDSGVTTVLKVALNAEQDERINQEYDALSRLRHPAVVAARGRATISGRATVMLEPAGERTLATLLREEGRLSLDLLERFGTDLLEATRELERRGIAHRDIKPDNLGVAPRGANDELHLVLFDFSLTRTHPENLRAGTAPYLEPFLGERVPPAWDVAAERWAATVVLYEMATGTTPTFGDGRSDPALIADEANVAADLLDAAVRAGLGPFFRTALRRAPAKRFADAGEMLRAWQRAFEDVDQPVVPVGATDPGDDPRDDMRQHPDDRPAITVPEAAAPASHLADVGLTSRLLSAAERLGASSVADLLAVHSAEIQRLRGVSNRTRRALVDWRRALEARFPTGVESPEVNDTGRSIDAIFARLLPRETARSAEEVAVLRWVLGIDPLPGQEDRPPGEWPDLAEVAAAAGIDRSQADRHLGAARARWANYHPAITALRHEVADLLAAHGDVVTTDELAASILALRGSEAVGRARAAAAAAVARAAAETEAAVKEPRFGLRRIGERGRRVLLVADRPGRDADATAAWVATLAARADELAERDPLLAGATLVEALRVAVPAEGAADLPDGRLVSLAAAASDGAAASARLELYPKGMDPARALRLGQGSLLGPQALTPAEVARRIRGRFPDASPLPDRPDLDRLLAEGGLALTWDDDTGCYRSPQVTLAGISSATALPTRFPTGTTAGTAAGPSEDAADFDARLRRSTTDGGFLFVTVPVRLTAAAVDALAGRGATHVDVDRLLIGHLRAEAARQRIPSFATVLAADAAPTGTPAATNLARLVADAVAATETTLSAAGAHLVLTGLGLLARYRHFDVIERLRDAAGAAGSPVRTVWAVIPVDHDGPPVLDGHPIPILGPGQWAAMPPDWLPSPHQAAS